MGHCSNHDPEGLGKWSQGACDDCLNNRPYTPVHPSKLPKPEIDAFAYEAIGEYMQNVENLDDFILAAAMHVIEKRRKLLPAKSIVSSTMCHYLTLNLNLVRQEINGT